MVSIPTCGKIDSLNVSVAAGILLYEISRHQEIAPQRKPL
jgi:23S rRNA (guanosine2251-2'-O)-methyltransferase